MLLKNLLLARPLAVLDLETTGTDPQAARVVEISVLRLIPPESRVLRTRRVNPGMPIPAEATAIHGITDADVANEPTFAKLARGLADFLSGCDLCGFNLKRYDLRVLHAEFRRSGVDFPLKGRAIIDPMEIFHAYERRDLSAAVDFYLASEHTKAHSAEADVLATAGVLDAMLACYDDLPRRVADLHQRFEDPNAVDSNGCFTQVGTEIRFAFGKFRGQPLNVVAQKKPDYLRWMLEQDFFDDTKTVVRTALQQV
jgi:DNA polymerase-3 subunit epsilon